MSDILLPPWLNIARLRTDYMDNTGMSRGLYTGAPETTGFGGDRLKFSLEFTPTSSSQSAVERAALRTFLARLRGRQNRAYLWDPSYRRRSSFPAVEQVSNNTFATGTDSGFSSSGSYTRTVRDRTYRATLNQPTTSSANLILSADNTVTPYVPYIGRVYVAGRALARQLTAVLRTTGGTSLATGTNLPSTNSEGGMVYATYAGSETSVRIALTDNAATAIAGDYADVSYVSVTRGALVDNGLNLLLQSDELDATWIATAATIDDQAAGAPTAPDGTVTADAIIGTAVNTNHFVSQAVTVASAAADYSFSVAFKAGARSWGLIQLNEATGGGNVQCYYDLSTGALGTAAAGTNWANVRAFITPLGGGWYKCDLVARKTGAATTITARVYAASANTVAAFTGDGATADVYAWRATLAQSSVPTRLIQTTTTAAAGASQAGSTLRIKGGRAPGEGALAGALLPDDRFEIITSRGSEMKIVTAPLDFDAAGLGYLQFEPPLLGTPADGAPIIIENPMTRAIFAGDMVGWDDSPGIVTTASAEFEEAA